MKPDRFSLTAGIAAGERGCQWKFLGPEGTVYGLYDMRNLLGARV